MGFDPTKSGGDLLWTTTVSYYSCQPWLGPVLPGLVLGPTGDIALAVTCGALGGNGSVAAVQRLNGGAHSLFAQSYQIHSVVAGLSFTPQNEMVLLTEASTWSYDSTRLDVQGAVGLSWSDLQFGLGQTAAYFGGAQTDALGNVFAGVGTNHALQLDGKLMLPAAGSYLARVGPAGESYYAGNNGFFAPDGQGGVYLYGALNSTQDFGCGPVVPAGPSSGYVAHLDSSWSCVFSDALPTKVSLLADAGGGAVISASSSAALDLGCGAIPVAPAGSTFVTRLGAVGTCVSAVAVAAPNLKVALDPSDRVVLSGLVDAVSVDLGGGPLAPVGTKDFVIAELDASGSYLWSGRYGGSGVSLPAFTSLTVVTSGDLYLLTTFAGTADLGGGPITAAGNPVVSSLSADGAHRWSRAMPITGNVAMGIDGCGALVVASFSASFDPGCGPLPAPFPPVPYIGVARFAP